MTRNEVAKASARGFLRGVALALSPKVVNAEGNSHLVATFLAGAGTVAGTGSLVVGAMVVGAVALLQGGGCAIHHGVKAARALPTDGWTRQRGGGWLWSPPTAEK